MTGVEAAQFIMYMAFAFGAVVLSINAVMVSACFCAIARQRFGTKGDDKRVPPQRHVPVPVDDPNTQDIGDRLRTFQSSRFSVPMVPRTRAPIQQVGATWPVLKRRNDPTKKQG